LNALNPKPGETVLDIGCGVGTFVFHSAKAGAKATGIDYSKESINAGQQLTARYKLNGTADFVVGSALQLPFADSSFDKIVSADFIEHITDEEKYAFCAEVRRVLKKDGVAVIFTPNKVREDLGLMLSTIKHYLFGTKIRYNELHYGLITKWKFNKILRNCGFEYKFALYDIDRPYLARIPALNSLLADNMLWILTKMQDKL
jgi:ubiquinone/menaquinone biosynthesis C-methylase UbiE